MKKIRNKFALAMAKRHHGTTVHRDRRKRRQNNQKRSWKREE